MKFQLNCFWRGVFNQDTCRTLWDLMREGRWSWNRQKCLRRERVCCIHLNNDRHIYSPWLSSESVNTWNYCGLNWTRVILRRAYQISRSKIPIDLARQRCTELTNIIQTSMVQMDCFRARRINKNVYSSNQAQ